MIVQPPIDDLYAVLGVPATASVDDMHAAYLDRCYLVHPDRLAGAPVGARRRAEQDMRRLNRAWETLSDPELRAVYDRTLAGEHDRRYAAPAVAVPVAGPASHGSMPVAARGRLARMAAPLLAGLLLAALIADLLFRWPSAVAGRTSAVETPVTATATTTATTTARSLIDDGGFEHSSPAWRFEPGAERVTTGGRGGAAALRLAGEGGWRTGYTSAATAAGGCHELQLWVRGAGAGRLDVLTADWERLTGIALSAEPEWTRYTLSFSAPAAAIIVAARDSATGAPLFLDDLSLTACQREP